VLAREKGDMHRKVPAGIRLERVLCIKEQRVVRNDYTVSYEGKFYQILCPVGKKQITIEKGLDNKIRLYDGNQRLKCKEIPYRMKRYWQKEETGSDRAGKQWIPPKNHPWRQYGNIKRRVAAPVIPTASNY